MEKQHYHEILLKLMLVLVRDRRAMQGRIHSVSFIREYGELPEQLGALSLKEMEEEKLLELAQTIGIKKAPAHAKAQIFLNDLGYCLQDLSGSIQIGTAIDRVSCLKICDHANLNVDHLDAIAMQLMKQENTLKCSEDIGFDEHKKTMKQFISYVLYEGSENGASHMPAEAVLAFTHPADTNTWEIYERQQYLEFIWDRLIVTYDENSEQNGQAWSGTINITISQN